jgi:hypothetical protein
MGKGLGWFSGNRALVLVSIAAVVGSVFTAVPASASTASNTRSISSSGTTSFGSSGLDGGVNGPELSPEAGGDAGATAANPSSVPSLPSRSKSDGKSGDGEGAGGSNRGEGNLKQLASFDGLNHNAQRFANGGNQFSVEPPDQGLCVGNGFVLETVNDVMAIYNQSGGLVKGPVDLNTFYGYAPAINRTTFVFGAGVTDPSCYFDKQTQRWFHVVLTLAVDPNIGRDQGPNLLDIAVSQTADPTGTWNVYKVPVQDDGTQGTPNHLCSADPNPALHPWRTNIRACIGDYPHIGADANGFYITTNEYAFFGPEYKAAQVYAFSKQALAAGSKNLNVTQIDTTNMVGGNQAGFTVWPAESPNGHFETRQGGTEYFLSSNAADEVNPALNGTSNHIVLWSLTNTRSLRSSHPDVTLTSSVLGVGRYAVPPMSQQKAGSTPLADCLNDTSLPVSPTLKGCWRLATSVQPAHNQVEGQTIDTNDTRMQQVTFADGMVFGALDTALKIDGKTQAGIEWFAVRPGQGSGGENNGNHDGENNGNGARVANQGYAGLANTNLSYPALAVNEHGVGAVAFTLVGPNDYPTAAYASFDAQSGTGDIHVAAAGMGPDDGFTNYHAAFALDRTRWGDYGAAVIDGSKLWMASEYIGQTCTYAQFITPPIGRCGGTRSALANWDTRITAVSLSD